MPILSFLVPLSFKEIENSKTANSVDFSIQAASRKEVASRGFEGILALTIEDAPRLQMASFKFRLQGI
jgi:hypothetical protein